MANSDQQHGLADAGLVSALLAGDDAAYEQLVRTYGGYLFTLAKRILQNEEDARDCVQEAFLQVFRKLDTFRGDASFKTWLHKLAVNAALMKMRARQNKRELLLTEWEGEFDPMDGRIEPYWTLHQTVEEQVMRAANCELVVRTIEQLPDQYRIVLLLRDIEGYDTANVAELLDMSVANVKTRLHRARAALKKQLEPLFGQEGKS